MEVKEQFEEMTMNEEWRDIIIEKNGIVYDYSALYQVSSEGKVRSLDRIDAKGNRRKGKILKPQKNNKGYLYVALSKNAKKTMLSIHRLVATMFIPNPDNLPVVNHKDENPSNCCVDNLEWATYEYNTNYGTCRQRISEAQLGGKNHMAKKIICIETGQVFDTVAQAGEWCGGCNIVKCCKGKHKTCGGYHWMYYDEWLAMTNSNNETEEDEK